MRMLAFSAGLIAAIGAHAGPFAPAAGQVNSTAIPADSPNIVAWASAVGSVTRGPQDISDELSPLASFGLESAVLGPANAYDPGGGFPPTGSNTALSLGDGGAITLLFSNPITDGPGWDFAIFENAFNDTFLELAFVEVSSDGTTFVRFPSSSLTPSGPGSPQIDQTDPNNSAIDPTNIDGLAGKYRGGFGTPFDLALLPATAGLDILRITHVRLVDVVGIISTDPSLAAFRTFDTAGRVINDPWPTPFFSGGFDLDAVAVLHQIPEPGAGALLFAGLLFATQKRRS
jgi:hypothetical protein